MKIITDVISDQIASAVGWTLLHSLWQGLIVFLLLIIILKFLKGKSSSVKYIISCSAFIILLGAIVVTFLNQYTDEGSITPQYDKITYTTASKYFETDLHSNHYKAVWNKCKQFIDHNADLIVWFWITGVIIMVIKSAGGWLYLDRKIKSTRKVIDDNWFKQMEEIACRLGIRRRIKLCESLYASVPFITGIVKPAIFIPAGMLSNMSASMVEAVFVHELNHIRRHDFLVNLIQIFAESLLFFNPFIWKISKIIRAERELACDENTLNQGVVSLEYAKSITWFHDRFEERTGLLHPALTGNGNNLLTRIKKILKPTQMKTKPSEKIIVSVILVFAFVLLITGSGIKYQNPHEFYTTGSVNLIIPRILAWKQDTLKKTHHTTTNNIHKENAKNQKQVYLLKDSLPQLKQGHFDIPEIDWPIFSGNFISPDSFYMNFNKNFAYSHWDKQMGPDSSGFPFIAGNYNFMAMTLPEFSSDSNIVFRSFSFNDSLLDVKKLKIEMDHLKDEIEKLKSDQNWEKMQKEVEKARTEAEKQIKYFNSDEFRMQMEDFNKELQENLNSEEFRAQMEEIKNEFQNNLNSDEFRQQMEEMKDMKDALDSEEFKEQMRELQEEFRERLEDLRERQIENYREQKDAQREQLENDGEINHEEINEPDDMIPDDAEQDPSSEDALRELEK